MPSLAYLPCPTLRILASLPCPALNSLAYLR
jgi:hypothetical protein